MKNVVVVGAQWGDEGKGKIVDCLSSRADIVIRFQGGHNAGHTLVIDGTEYKLSLLPSGIVRGGKLSVIGNGVVVDPWALLAEMDRVREKGVTISPDNLIVAENCPLILPVHGMVDRARENAASTTSKIGTTGRGIGPAYEDKIARRAIRLCDLTDPAALKEKIERLTLHHNASLRGFGAEEIDPVRLYDDLMEVAPKVLPYAAVVWKRLEQARHDGKLMLFEGAQGAMLDIDHGTYPFVTSSNVAAGQASAGAGVGPKVLGRILGICKAYTTRVGSGPFPTEDFSDKGELLGMRGKEFGVVTGRKRRCGWFDAVAVRQAVKISGIDGITLTKLDILDGFDEIKICRAYKLDGQEIDYLPACASAQARVEPIYDTVKGWKETIRGARSWADLPSQAVKYVRLLEEMIDTPIIMVSTSPERDDTIWVRDPFAD